MQVEDIKVRVLPDGRLDVHNASLYLGLAEKTLAMLRSSGDGPRFVKMGKVFYFRADLDAWIDARRALSTAHGAQVVKSLRTAAKE